MLRVCVVAFVALACRPLDVPASRRPDGVWHLTCGSALEACVKRAREICHERGFVVLGGTSKREVYGAELGRSQVEAVQAELDVACEDRRGYLPKVVAPPAPATSSSSTTP